MNCWPREESLGWRWGGGHHTPGDPKAVLGARGPLLSPSCAPRRAAGLSESEAEPDGEHNITELPQAVAGRGNMRAQQSAVRLTEVRLSAGQAWCSPIPREGLTPHPVFCHPSRLGLG